MRPTTKCREYRDNRVGRYRRYKCRRCGRKFSRFLVDSLPEKERICDLCHHQTKGGQQCP